MRTSEVEGTGRVSEAVGRAGVGSRCVGGGDEEFAGRVGEVSACRACNILKAFFLTVKETRLKFDTNLIKIVGVVYL